MQVVSQERVSDALALMRLPADTNLTEPVAREACLRDGNVKLLLSGRVEKIGSTYTVTVNIIDPARDVTIATDSEDAATVEQLVRAVHRLNDRVRRDLGEDLPQIRESDLQLAKVATPSAEALRLYTQAERLMHKTTGILFNPDAQASDLLQQAVRIDPDFASAHLLLAITLKNLNELAPAKMEFARAMQLAGTATDRERLFIVAIYYDNLGGGDAVQAYQALLQLYPDDYWATENLAGHYWKAGDVRDSVDLQYRLADLRPNDLEVNNTAATFALFFENDRKRFQRYRTRAESLAAQEDKNSNADDLAVTNLLPFQEAWVDGDAARAAVELHQAQAVAAGSLYDHILFGMAYASLGQFGKAEGQFERFGDREVASLIEARLAYIRGNVEKSRALLRLAPAFPNAMDWWLRAATGLWKKPGDIGPEYRVWINQNKRGAEIVFAEMALRQSGNRTEPILRMERALATPPNGEPLSAAASVSLARAYERQGQFASAARVLERETTSVSQALAADFILYAPYWLQAKFELAKVDRHLGRPAEAAKIESELAKWLAVADADDPILVGLKQGDRTEGQATVSGH